MYFILDANSTLRLTYGNVKAIKARDAVQFDFYTCLDGVMEKYKPAIMNLMFRKEINWPV